MSKTLDIAIKCLDLAIQDRDAAITLLNALLGIHNLKRMCNTPENHSVSRDQMEKLFVCEMRVLFPTEAP